MTENIINAMNDLGYGSYHVFRDESLDLTAIIALHSYDRGPAIGGCRCVTYDSFNSAVMDALRLGEAMSRKSAIHGLQHGGGKSVIIRPKVIANREKFFRRFGEFVHALNGNYVTAVDSGTTPTDMTYIAQSTPHVLNYPCSSVTALGVFKSYLAATSYLFKDNSLPKPSILVQGLGSVGYELCSLLNTLNVNLLVCDIDTKLTKRAESDFNARIIPIEQLRNTVSDVFMPCALGGVLDEEFCKHIQTKLIVGGANNQLTNPKNCYEILKARRIRWVPDYLVNGGGLICAASHYQGFSQAFIDAKLSKLADSTEKFLATEDNTDLKLDEILYELS